MGEGRGVIFLLCMKDGLLSMAVKQLIFLFCLWGGEGTPCMWWFSNLKHASESDIFNQKMGKGAFM